MPRLYSNSMVNQPVIDLGLILNDIKEYEFSMKKFSDRLKLQKTIYLLQSFGIYLGYDFSWYLRGPYCTSLTMNAFVLEDINSAIPKNKKIHFVDRDKQKSFEGFKKFIQKKDVDDLEILASIHFLKKIDDGSDDEIKIKVEKKRTNFTKDRVEEMWKELKEWKLL